MRLSCLNFSGSGIKASGQFSTGSVGAYFRNEAEMHRWSKQGILNLGLRVICSCIFKPRWWFRLFSIVFADQLSDWTLLSGGTRSVPHRTRKPTHSPLIFCHARPNWLRSHCQLMANPLASMFSISLKGSVVVLPVCSMCVVDVVTSAGT